MNRRIFRKIILGILINTVIILFSAANADNRKAKSNEDERWSLRKTWQWYKSVSPIRGCNYLPSTTVNMTEMWQTENLTLIKKA